MLSGQYPVSKSKHLSLTTLNGILNYLIYKKQKLTNYTYNDVRNKKTKAKIIILILWNQKYILVTNKINKTHNKHKSAQPTF